MLLLLHHDISLQATSVTEQSKQTAVTTNHGQMCVANRRAVTKPASNCHTSGVSEHVDPNAGDKQGNNGIWAGLTELDAGHVWSEVRRGKTVEQENQKCPQTKSPKTQTMTLMRPKWHLQVL